MMSCDLPIFCLSLNHKNTPVEVRKLFAFSQAEASALLARVVEGSDNADATGGVAGSADVAPATGGVAGSCGAASATGGVAASADVAPATGGVAGSAGAVPASIGMAASVAPAFASGAVLLATCNRTELYFAVGAAAGSCDVAPATGGVTGSANVASATGGVAGSAAAAREGTHFSANERIMCAQQLIVASKQQDVHLFRQYCRSYVGKDAVRHLFAVASGLDSMVLGENEVLGQLREAYKRAAAEHRTDFYINFIFQRALSCAKRVKTETNLSKATESIATLAVKEIMAFRAATAEATTTTAAPASSALPQASASQAPTTVLLIGASGQTGSLIVRDLAERNGVRVFVTLRRHYALPELPNVQKIAYDERYAYLDCADVVVSATTSPHFTVAYNNAAAALHTQKPRLFLDLAVPNDFEPELQTLPLVTLKNIDCFTKLAAEHNQQKQRGAAQASDIVAEELDATVKELLFHGEIDFVQSFGALLRERNGLQLLYDMRSAASADELNVLLALWHRMYRAARAE